MNFVAREFSFHFHVSRCPVVWSMSYVAYTFFQTQTGNSKLTATIVADMSQICFWARGWKLPL